MAPLPSSQNPKMNPDGPLVAHSPPMKRTTNAAPVSPPSLTAIAPPGTTPDAAPVFIPTPPAIGYEQVEEKPGAIHSDILAEIDAMYDDAAIDDFRDNEQEAVVFAEEVSDEEPEVYLDCTCFF